MIGIIGAMPIELAPFLKSMQIGQTDTAGGFTFYTGMLCGKQVVAMCCGVGKVNAALGAQTMILRYAPEWIVNAGVAGALSPELHICDAVVAKDYVQFDVDTTALGDPPGFVSSVQRVGFPTDPAATAALYEAALALPGARARIARIGTGDQFLTHADDKMKIMENFGAVACDMEGCAIAQACYVNGVKCAGIRTISDASSDAHQEEYAQFVGAAAARAAEITCKFLESASKIV